MAQTPIVGGLQPSTKLAGSGAFTLTVLGANFSSTSRVQWNGQDRPTNFFSPTTLEAAISSADISQAGTAEVTVAEGENTSNAVNFSITISRPLPIITNLSPSSKAAGGPAFTLTIRGGNFTGSSVVQWEGSDRETIFVDSTTLTATILAQDTQEPGMAEVVVKETAPGGGSSESVEFVIEIFNTISFAHVAVGGGYSTQFTVTNTGAEAAIAVLFLTDTNGDPLTVDLTESTFAAEEAISGEFAVVDGISPLFTVESGGSKTLTATGTGDNGSTQTGWAEVLSVGGNLEGIATFRQTDGSELLSVAGVLGSDPVQSATIPVDSDVLQNRFAGFAVANPNDEEMGIKLLTVNEDGSISDILTPPELNPLGAGNQIAKFLHQFLASGSRFKGSVVLLAEGGKGFVVVALIQERGLLTVTPSIPGTSHTVPN